MTERKWNVPELMRVSGSFWETCTLHTAVDLDVFTLLSGQTLTAREVAEVLEVPVDGLSRLLNALTAMNLLQKNDNKYSAVAESRRFLSRESEEYMGFIIRHHHQLSKTWSRMDEVIRSGKSFRNTAEELSETQVESFLMGMNNLSRLNGPAVLEKLDLSSYGRLLDVGGGPGTYSIQFCTRYPNLTATVFDLPQSQPFAEKNIRENGLENRIHFAAGNFNHDPLPQGYDIMWMSHILHSEGPEACGELLAQAAASLQTGGVVVIHEFILDDDGASPLFPALFSLNMLLHTQNGRSYTENELNQMLSVAGFCNLKRIPVNTPANSGIIMGVKA